MCRAIGAACYTGDLCTSNLTCAGCGGRDQPCCTGNTCSSALLACSNSTCVTCGAAGQPACTGVLPCRGGSCLDPVTGRCVATGKNSANDAGTVCQLGTFVTCGHPGEPCCAETTCEDGCCAGQRCVVFDAGCGGPISGGQPLGTCTSPSQSCGSCGGLGQSCCDSNQTYTRDFCTASGLACNNSRQCVACGGPTQACCSGNLCANGGCCTDGVCVANGGSCPSSQGACRNGGCNDGGCGRIGQSRCTFLDCTGPYTVDYAAQCVSCGGLGQRCCDEYGADGWCGLGTVCYAYTCEACGASGQRCCSGRFCNGGQTCDNFGRCP